MPMYPDFVMDDRWILSHRTSKNRVDPAVPYAWLRETEYFPLKRNRREDPDSRYPMGRVKEVGTVFLTNRECPYRCLMCDLWKNTTDRPVPPGAIPAQILYALEQMPGIRHIKLYNSGNFFDRNAVPREDYRAIAGLLEPFDTVIVESHPKRLGEACLEFSRLIRPDLQVALGLETVHPEVLPRLNKRMTLRDFENAVSFLRRNGIGTRAFILLKPPFLDEGEGVDWALKSIEFAFDCGVDICAVIPTRSGNGAMEILEERGCFSPPGLKSLEEVLEYGIGLQRGPVFADLWDLEKFSSCDACFSRRKHRLEQMNLGQVIPERVSCDCSA
jgi:radical SAM enzyme (TIGR01210 family)